MKQYFIYSRNDINLEKVVTKSYKCKEIIVEAKENHIKEINKNLKSLEKAPKAYWNILNCFLNNKKIPSYLHY